MAGSNNFDTHAIEMAYTDEVIDLLRDIESVADVSPNQANCVYNLLKRRGIVMGECTLPDGRRGRTYGKCVYVLDHSLTEGVE